MSIGSAFPVAASLAGTGLAQTTGSDVGRARQDAVSQQRGIEATAHAEDAAGIARTDGDDNQAHDRDADGRVPWQLGRDPSQPGAADPATTPLQSKDATGESGNQLDLTG